MTDFNELEQEAKKLAQEHPDQVKEGEQRLEKDLGVPGDQQQPQTDPQQQSGP